jgi:hypothetical protein
LLDCGTYNTNLFGDIYRLPSTVQKIKDTLPDKLRAALTVMESVPDGENADEVLYPAVDHIRIVVKQLKGFQSADFTNAQAGALTQSTVLAMKQLCGESVGDGTPSKLVDRHDKLLGSLFLLTKLSTGQKFEVSYSSFYFACQLHRDFMFRASVYLLTYSFVYNLFGC